jgi:hypothetical protein
LVLDTSIGTGGRDLGAARDETSDARNIPSKRGPIRHHRIHSRRIYDEGKMFNREIGRTKNQAARDAVELDKR